MVQAGSFLIASHLHLLSFPFPTQIHITCSCFPPFLVRSITRCVWSCNLLMSWSLSPSSIPAHYLSVILDIHPFYLTPSLLSTTTEFVSSWQWDLCEASMKRDPHSVPFGCWLASTMTCIIRSARDVHSFGSCSFCSCPLSILFHHNWLSSNERISSTPFFDLHHTTQSWIVIASSSQLSLFW